jgi:hypothetical protein
VYDEIGYNLKPTDQQAAMGLVQLKRLPQIIDMRKRNYKRLCEIFSKYEEHFIIPKATEGSDPAWFAFPLTLKNGCPFKRKDIVDYLEENKIQTRPYFAGNIMLQPAYAGMMNQQDVIKNYPNARKVTTDTFFLGTSPVITPEQMDYIETLTVERIKRAIRHFGFNSGFVYLELLELNQMFVSKIKKASEKTHLMAIWQEMLDKAFLGYRASDSKLLKVSTLENLSITDLKKFLLDTIDTNMLYVPITEIEDSDYGVDPVTKKYNKEFFGDFLDV